MCRIAYIAAALASLSLAPAARADTLFAQAAVSDSARVGLGFFSHAERGARRDHRHADDFRLDRGAVITAVRWWGLVDGTRTTGLANVRGFTLRVLEAAPGGEPGRVVVERVAALDQTRARPTGRAGSGAGEASTAAEYAHELRFEPPLALNSGRTYFLEIAAHLVDPAGDNWQWQDGETSNGVSYSFSYRQQRWLRIEDTDSAFALIGVVSGPGL